MLISARSTSFPAQTICNELAPLTLREFKILIGLALGEDS